MGHSEKTPKLNLPIVTDTDKPTWRGDFNYAMRTIDGSLGAVGEGNQNVVTQINRLDTRVNDMGETVNTMRSEFDNIEQSAERLQDADARILAAEASAQSARGTAGAASALASTTSNSLAAIQGQVNEHGVQINGLSSRLTNVEGGGGGADTGGGLPPWYAQARYSGGTFYATQGLWLAFPLVDQEASAGNSSNNFTDGGILIPTNGVYLINATLTFECINQKNEIDVKGGISPKGVLAPETVAYMTRSQFEGRTWYSGHTTEFRYLTGGTILKGLMKAQDTAARLQPMQSGTVCTVLRVA